MSDDLCNIIASSKAINIALRVSANWYIAKYNQFASGSYDEESEEYYVDLRRYFLLEILRVFKLNNYLFFHPL
jgi:hypothetical protein